MIVSSACVLKSQELSLALLPYSEAVKRVKAGADLGFYKGGHPIHLKETPEVERAGSREGVVPPPQKIFVFLVSKW